MKEPMKFYRNEYWLAFPLLVSGVLGALGIVVSSHFAVSGLVMAAGLVVMTVGLCYWSRNRYRMSLQTIEQGLFEGLQQKNEEVIKALRDAHHETVSLACARQVEAERNHLKTLSTDLAQRFDALSKRLGGQEEEKTEHDDSSVEAQIADLAQRFDALIRHLDQQSPSVEKQEPGIDGLDSLCQKVLPIWSSQVEMARVHTEESIADLAQRFDALSKRLDAAVYDVSKCRRRR